MEIHKGSLDTYNTISKWIYPTFFFSFHEKWDRMGMLGVFGDYVLSCTSGDILEIGVGESSIYLSALAKKWNRKIYYCDISPSKIINPRTVKGYLNEEHGIFFMDESDKFFKEVQISPIALAFIDGDHSYEQVKKDFLNLIPLVVDNGYIILHDIYPPSEDYIHENACGEVYKLRQQIEKDDSLDCITLTRGCAMGVGFTIVRKKPKDRPYYQQ